MTWSDLFKHALKNQQAVCMQRERPAPDGVLGRITRHAPNLSVGRSRLCSPQTSVFARWQSVGPGHLLHNAAEPWRRRSVGSFRIQKRRADRPCPWLRAQKRNNACNGNSSIRCSCLGRKFPLTRPPAAQSSKEFQNTWSKMLLAAARKFSLGTMVAARHEEQQTSSHCAEYQKTLNGENHRVG
jgi:hypothetical protein